jgi:hypothetical protein
LCETRSISQYGCYLRGISTADEKYPSAALSGRLTALAAWQEVAPYSSRRHPSSLVIAPYFYVRLIPQDFGRPRKRDFVKLNLHLNIFAQPLIES